MDNMNEIQEGYIPTEGLGALLHLPEINKLQVKPEVKFFPKTKEPIVRYNLYNTLEESIHFSEVYLDGPCVLVFSAFLKSVSTISIADWIKKPLRVPEINEKLKVVAKKDRKKNRLRLAQKDEPLLIEMEIIPKLEQCVMIDPMTDALLDDCSIAFSPAIESLYRIGHVIVQEDLEDITPEIVLKRTMAFQSVNAFMDAQNEKLKEEEKVKAERELDQKK